MCLGILSKIKRQCVAVAQPHYFLTWLTGWTGFVATLYLAFPFFPPQWQAFFPVSFDYFLTVLFMFSLLGAGYVVHLKMSHTEASLHQAKKRFYLALQGAHAGLWEYDMTSGSMIWSEHLLSLLGFPPHSCPAQRPTWKTFVQRIHPDDVDWVLTLLQQHWDYKTLFDVEFRIVHETGNYIWVHGVGQAEWDEKNHPVRMAGSLTSIHKRKMTEQQMHHLSQNNRNILNALDQSAIVAITDPKGVITHANQQFCHISGYSRSELLGQTHRIVNSGIHERVFFKELWETISAGQAWQGDVCNRNKEGELYWVKTTIIPFLDAQGKPYQYVSYRQDITAQKLAEEELIVAKNVAEQASQLKSQFLKIISHELRTPLNAITGVNQLLKDTSLSGEQQELCQTLQQSSQALHTLVSDILDFEHLSQSSLSLEHAPFNIHQLLNQVINHAQASNHNQNTFHLDVKTPPPHTFCGDARRIRQVLTQLVRNATTHTHQGDITLSVVSDEVDEEHTQCALTFQVRDTGCGIPADKLAQLFDPFTQLEKFSTRKTGGLGLGLAICQKIIHCLGGNLTAHSIVGGGSVFEFTLCLPCETDTTWAPSSIGQSSRKITPDEPAAVVTNGWTLSSAGQMSHPGAHLLLVEDNDINQMVTSRLLEKLGYTVTVAENGLKALDLIHQYRYALILMDVQMPEMDGLETTQRIRRYEAEHPEHPRIPIVALTANVMSGDKEECLAAGMDDYLGKPVEKEQLARMLQKYQVQSAHSSKTR